MKSMVLFGSTHRLVSNLLALTRNASRPMIVANSWKRFSTKTQRSKQLPKYLVILTFGAASYYLFDQYRDNSITEFGKTEPTLNLDLNEIYEKTAVVFLSNSELRDALGMPIKITSHNSIADTIRAVDLTREGSDVYSFIAYTVQGSQNSGVVYCKSKMDPKTEKFKAESILLKLHRPDSQKRTEIVIKGQIETPKDESAQESIKK